MRLFAKGCVFSSGDLGELTLVFRHGYECSKAGNKRNDGDLLGELELLGV